MDYELVSVKILLFVSFVIAPMMTRKFFLENSKPYALAHAGTLFVVSLGELLHAPYVSFSWSLFCLYGSFLFFKKNKYMYPSDLVGIASYLPFIFSVVSSIWFVSGQLDLNFLGYDKMWSFFAALHGAFLGWIVLGCIWYISKTYSNQRNVYLLGCYLSAASFFLVAFGIDGIAYIKPLGALCLSLLIPFLIGYFFLKLADTRLSRFLSAFSLLGIIVSAALALSNEFGVEILNFRLTTARMIFFHGYINGVVVVPFFYFAIDADRKAMAVAGTRKDSLQLQQSAAQELWQ